MGVWGNLCKGTHHGENPRFSEQVLPRNSRGSAILITLAPDLFKSLKKSRKKKFAHIFLFNLSSTALYIYTYMKFYIRVYQLISDYM